MPELPEAETLVRGLRPRITGETISRTRVLKEDLLRTSARAFRDAISGRTITAVERRAKNLVFELDGGDRRLITNLGMTGGYYPLGYDLGSDEPSHVGVRFHFGSGRKLVFRDVRRFGCLEVDDREAWAVRDARIGPEPLDDTWTAERLHADLLRSRSPLRSWLLDQRRVAGVGNIYANEAGFLAGIRPTRPANEVTPSEAALLHAGIRSVLSEAIARGGTTLRDYRDAGGEPGGFGRQLLVYGREGEPCVTCGTPIERLVLSNRSAFLCPECQS